MIKGFYTAKASLMQGQRQTNVISNNIANIITTNYKQSKTSFEQILGNQINKNHPDFNKTEYLVGGGAKIKNIAKDFTQGDLIETEDSLDLALRGDGFFTLVDDDNNQFFTRGGHFSFLPQRYQSKNIVNENGYYLANSQGQKIDIPSEVEDVVISDKGEIFYDMHRGSQNIGVVAFASTNELEEVEAGIYDSKEQRTIDSKAVVMQGYLELSNTNLANELTSLIINQRMFAINSQVIQTVDEISKLANHLR